MLKPLLVLFSFFFILISLKFKVNGQCEEKYDHSTVTSCNGSTRSGQGIYSDFGKIGRPCTCIVTSLFNGELYVISHKTTHVLCKNRVRVNNTVIFDCNDDGFEKFDVKINDSIIVKAEYKPGHTSERFNQCLFFINYGYKYNELSVRCGPQPPTTSSTTTSTMSSTDPQLAKTTSAVSLKESTAAVNNRKATHFTTTFILNTRQCRKRGDHSTVTRCDGSARSGRGIYADFGKIGRPCTCIVTSLFNGELYVISHKTTHVLCTNRVRVNNTVIIDCKDDGFKKFDVKTNDTITVKAEYQPVHTTERFNQCLVFLNYGDKYNKLSVRCGLPPRTTSSTTTTTVSTTASVLTKTSLESIVSSTESKDVFNNKNGARLSPSLNTGTADLSFSSKDPTTMDPETKKDAYSTITNVLKTSTADLKSSLEDSVNSDPENISVLASIATGGIVLAIALVICIIIIMNRIMKERNNGLVMKSTKANRAFGNNISLPNNPLNNISLHVEEVDDSSAQNRQLGLLQTVSKSNHKIISDYDVPPNNKTVDQGVYSLAKNEVPNKND